MEKQIKEVEHRVFMQLYAASATCFVFLSYLVFSLQIVHAVSVV